ncbi:hypothetical protein [Puniceibacterium confluentis]|uniref:hypothetical protein n=1 Tax=Puniceibacterium confluentis TaxID=1958944 RepID=UPI001FEC074E|nr:hypothetical protein [Puniceibacterium confluentis]
MITFLALTVMVGSTLMVLSNLRLVAQDTFQVLRDAVGRGLRSGHLGQKLAFGALWALIFALASL